MPAREYRGCVLFPAPGKQVGVHHCDAHKRRDDWFRFSGGWILHAEFNLVLCAVNVLKVLGGADLGAPVQGAVIDKEMCCALHLALHGGLCQDSPLFV